MQNVESHIREYLDERNWNQLRPSDVAKSLIIEAAELLEVFQWSSMTVEETKRDELRMAQIKKELADVFIYALDMAVILDLDSEAIILEKLKQVKKKYPAQLMRDNARKPGSNAPSVYDDIKQAHRREGLN